MDQNLRYSSAEAPRDDNTIPREIEELGQLIAVSTGTNQANLESAYQRVLDSVRRRQRILMLVQEALSQLRLDIKYLMFDLDVTRRERDELRQQLEDQ